MNILIAALPFLGILTVIVYVLWFLVSVAEMNRQDARWRYRCEWVRRRMQAEDEIEARLEQFDLQEFISR